MNIQNSSTAPAAQNQTVQSVETVTMPLELAHRLQNATYFYHLALKHITKTFIPSIAAAASSGNTRLICNQLDTLGHYIEQCTENYDGMNASLDFCELDENGFLLRGQSEHMATSTVYNPD